MAGEKKTEEPTDDKPMANKIIDTIVDTASAYLKGAAEDGVATLENKAKKTNVGKAAAKVVTAAKKTSAGKKPVKTAKAAKKTAGKKPAGKKPAAKKSAKKPVKGVAKKKPPTKAKKGRR